jgi:hypothetical protein
MSAYHFYTQQMGGALGTQNLQPPILIGDPGRILAPPLNGVQALSQPAHIVSPYGQQQQQWQPIADVQSAPAPISASVSPIENTNAPMAEHPLQSQAQSPVAATADAEAEAKSASEPSRGVLHSLMSFFVIRRPLQCRCPHHLVSPLRLLPLRR